MHPELIGRGEPIPNRVPAAVTWWLYLHDDPNPQSNQTAPKVEISQTWLWERHVPGRGPGDRNNTRWRIITRALQGTYASCAREFAVSFVTLFYL
jgi:hypothetical protein